MGSSVYTASTAIDNRLAVTDSGVGLSSSGNGNSVTLNLTDQGAIDKAFQFASNSAQVSQSTVKDVLGVAKGNFEETTSALAGAYKDAKGGVEVFQNLSYVMLGIIGLVSYLWLSKKRGA